MVTRIFRCIFGLFLYVLFGHAFHVLSQNVSANVGGGLTISTGGPYLDVVFARDYPSPGSWGSIGSQPCAYATTTYICSSSYGPVRWSTWGASCGSSSTNFNTSPGITSYTIGNNYPAAVSWQAVGTSGTMTVSNASGLQAFLFASGANGLGLLLGSTTNSVGVPQGVPVSPGGTLTLANPPSGSVFEIAQLPPMTVPVGGVTQVTNSAQLSLDGMLYPTSYEPSEFPVVSAVITNWVPLGGVTNVSTLPVFVGVTNSVPVISLESSIQQNQVSSLTNGQAGIVSAIGNLGTQLSSYSSGSASPPWSNGLTSLQYVNDTLYLQTNQFSSTNQLSVVQSSAVALGSNAILSADVGAVDISNVLSGVSISNELGIADSYINGNAAFDSNAVGAFLSLSCPIYDSHARITGYNNYDLNWRHSLWWSDLCYILRGLTICILSWEYLWTVYHDVDSGIRSTFQVQPAPGNSELLASPLGVGFSSRTPAALINGLLIIVSICAIPLLFLGAIASFGGSAFWSNILMSPLGWMEGVSAGTSSLSRPYMEFAIETVCDLVPLGFLISLALSYMIWSLTKDLAVYLCCAVIKLAVT